VHSSFRPVEASHLFLIKKTDAAIGDLERQIQLVLRFSERKALSSTYSMGERGYTLDDLGSDPEMSSIAWSH